MTIAGTDRHCSPCWRCGTWGEPPWAGSSECSLHYDPNLWPWIMFQVSCLTSQYCQIIFFRPLWHKSMTMNHVSALPNHFVSVLAVHFSPSILKVVIKVCCRSSICCGKNRNCATSLNLRHIPRLHDHKSCFRYYVSILPNHFVFVHYDTNLWPWIMFQVSCLSTAESFCFRLRYELLAFNPEGCH